MNFTKPAFTLVELIIVIAILAILSTISLISYQSYSSYARDGGRLADLNSINTALELVFTKTGAVPPPQEPINISATGSVILLQGYFGSGALGDIAMHIGGTDPLDETYYTYVTDTSLSVYQVLGFLEQDNNNVASQLLPQSYADMSHRFPVTAGDSLGVLLESTTLEPVHLGATDVDIALTTTIYTLYMGNTPSDIISGTGSILLPQIYAENPFLFPIVNP